jgi:hypothetical protein
VPDSLAVDNLGTLYAFNGIDAPVAWHPDSPVAEPVGLDPPATRLTLTGLGDNLPGTTGRKVYVGYQRFLDRFGNASNLSPESLLAETGEGGYSYTDAEAPADPRVTRRQFLRNTQGQFNVFYVDIDTADLTGTSFTSTSQDGDLAENDSVVLLDDDGRPVANANGKPPAHPPFAAFHLGRLWLAGAAEYSEGSVRYTNRLAVGFGTRWTPAMVGRQFHLNGVAQEIVSVDVAAQTLRTDPAGPFAYPADFAGYAIRAYPADSRNMYFSGAGTPHAWSPLDAFEVPADGDEVTGLMPFASFLYLLKRRHLYRVTANADPFLDGALFLAARRGCVNHRCWAHADEATFLMDEGGVYALSPGGDPVPVSGAVEPLFRPPAYAADRINWQASRFFHASIDPGPGVARFLVCLRGEYLPRHALCYGYRRQRWWVEEYPVPVGAAVASDLGPPTGGWGRNPERLLLGMPAAAFAALDGSPTDGPAGTAARGRVGSATPLTLTDPTARFPDLTNVPVAVASGRGRAQVRVVVSNTATRLTVDRPWAVRPDRLSTYQVGGIAFRHRTPLLRLSPSEDRDGGSVELLFPPTAGASARLAVAPGFSAAERVGYAVGGGTAQARRGEPGRDIDLSDETGAFTAKFDRGRERLTTGRRFVRLGLDGVSGDPPTSFGETILNGVV